jgi:carboxymethylenebutenolidase
MTVVTRTERITAPDGGQFDAHAFVPREARERGSVPGVLLLQEIYGVDQFLKSRATQLAGLGYAVLCPDVFWRVGRNVSLAHDEAALEEAFGYMARFADIPAEVTVGDLVAGLERLRALPEVGGGGAGGSGEARRVAVMGYCLGGRLAYEVAVAGEPDACVSYYGSGIASELELAERISCPVLFQFGGADPYIAREDIDRIAAVFTSRPGAEFVVHEQAGHAFENSFAPMFSNPEAASASWPLTLDFLERTLRG